MQPKPRDRVKLPPPPYALVISKTAFFFDFDGVIADITEEPEFVAVNDEVRAHLRRLSVLANGALAIISGRELSNIDKHLAPFKPAAAGVHGLEWRLPDGTVREAQRPTIDLKTVEKIVSAAVERHHGLLMEKKRAAIALHYRRRPDLADVCDAVARRVNAQCNGISTVRGKMVIEFKAGGRTKGDAVMTYMSAPPFAGRQPLFVGDDTTDEDAFRVLTIWNGWSIKVGSGSTDARYRLRDTADVRHWLAMLLKTKTEPAMPEQGTELDR